MKRPINESVQFAIRQLGVGKSRVALNYHDHLVEFFKGDLLSEANEQLTPEQVQEQQKVLGLIKADKWERGAQEFFNSVKRSKHAKMLSDYSIEELKQMDTYKVPGYNIGFALKDHDGTGEGGSGHKGRVEIVAVHNNSNVPNVGRAVMKAAIAKGGKTLDHFDGFLTPFYEGLGFEEYKRDPYNPQYDEDGAFAKKYGKKDVIYRRLKQQQQE